MARTARIQPAQREPYVRVIGKAIAALDQFLDGQPVLTLPELSRRLGMSRSTVHRLLTTMEHHQLVDRTPAGAYQLGIHLFRLGSSVHVPAVLAGLATPGLEALAERFALSSYLSVRDGERALCVARVDRGPVKTTIYQVGDTLPLYMGAGPNVLLAELPTPELDRILRRPITPITPKVVVEPRAIRARLAKIRESGMAYAADDVQIGLAAMGVPVRDGAGGVIAAISVVALTRWFAGEQRGELSVALRATAAEIEAALVPQHG